MKTNFDAIDAIWKRLTAQQIATAISGEIYKLQRPFNSDKEDIVINALPITETIPQECVVNVNCYVPNLIVKVKGQETKMPDTVRIKQISDLVLSKLENVAEATFHYFVTNQAVLANESGNEYYSNIRLTFIFTNI
ncbi:MAG: hypothetical protein Q8J88_00915 [Bacteroidales bacterium]|nr:hypothetical protein [Bacteroidales bacterium]